MVFSGFEVHWNTAFHAMSFTNKTVRIMGGVIFSLQRNQEIEVSSWGADLSLEGTNWTEWSSWWWLWYWEVAGAKLGRSGCEGLFPKPALLPLTQRGSRDRAEPEQLFIPRLEWETWLITGKKWDHSEAELLPGWCSLGSQDCFALRIWGSGEKEDGINW